MKAVDLFINQALPPDLRDYSRPMDKKHVDAVLAEVARRYPDQYSDIVQHFSDVGRNAAYSQGETLSLKDFEPVLDRDAILKEMDTEVREAEKGAKNPQEKEKIKLGIWSKYANRLEKETATSARGTSLGRSVNSGARGNPLQLRSILTTPAIYTDYRDRPIPLFVRHSFSEGLRPAEYLASSFGTRRSVISTKKSTALGGDLSKQLNAVSTPLIVTEDDCNTNNGLDFDINDANIHGRVLAKAVGKLPAGTVVDKHTLQQLRQTGAKRVIVRSPMTCTAHSGICSHCLGVLPEGHFAPKGYAAGITAAQSVGEPITQTGLSAKHTGGAGSGAKKEFSGFDVINQLVQSPETFPNKAVLAEEGGRIAGMEDAPQGGKYIKIGETNHYVLPGFEPLVKVNDEVEPGEQLSEGIADVADVVRLRGLGEGRKYYVNRLKQAMQESGYGKPSNLQLELLARSTLDHAVVDDPDGMGSYLPDDTISYQQLANTHVLPKSAEMTSPEKAAGRFLHAPALHYTIGTKLTPKMTQHLREAGINGVVVSDEEPKFHSEMVRLRSAAHNNPDWFARMHSSYLTTGLQEAANRAHDTSLDANVHFAPRLAVGKDFGKNVEETGKF